MCVCVLIIIRIYLNMYAYLPGLFQSHTIKNAKPWKKITHSQEAEHLNNRVESPTLLCFAFQKTQTRIQSDMSTFVDVCVCVMRLCKAELQAKNAKSKEEKKCTESDTNAKWKAERNDQEMCNSTPMSILKVNYASWIYCFFITVHFPHAHKHRSRPQHQ